MKKMLQINLDNNIRDTWLWGGKDNRFKWWIDLLLICVNNLGQGYAVGNKMVVCKRGQIAMTLSRLAERWKTDRMTVRHYIDNLKKNGFIEYTSCTTYSVITILDFEGYISNVVKVRTPEDTSEMTEDDVSDILLCKCMDYYREICRKTDRDIPTTNDLSVRKELVNLIVKVAHSRQNRTKPLPTDDNSMAEAIRLYLEMASDALKGQSYSVHLLNLDYDTIRANVIKQMKEQEKLTHSASGDISQLTKAEKGWKIG